MILLSQFMLADLRAGTMGDAVQARVSEDQPKGSQGAVPGRTMIKILCIAVLLSLLPLVAEEPGVCLVKAARVQIGVTVGYDPTYVRIPYPKGDVPLDRGVCTDVIIRAYRAFSVDLQVLVHQDMKSAWGAYPNPWRMQATDCNIDHRRVPNLATFFKRHGESIAELKDPTRFLPGDVVTWKLPSGVPHIGIVSDQRTTRGTPLIVHNIGGGAQEEDALFLYTLTGHYRYLPDQLIHCSIRK